MGSETPGIRTPDQRLRVFVSSTLKELATERSAVREAVTALRLTPVMFEQGARPHPPRELYRAYVEQSDVFVGLYWQRYGWVAPDMTISGLEDEYDLCGDRPRLLYLKRPAPDREPRLAALLERIETEGLGSYRRFTSPDELAELVRDDLAVLLSERFTWSGGVSKTPQHPAMPAPRPLTPLIGRDRELDEVQTLLTRSDVRLVTLTGAGGIGKTRLALQLITLTSTAFPRGATYVPLAAVRDPALVLSTIASAVGVAVQRGQSPLDALVGHFDAPGLIVTDNMEQIPGGGVEIAELLSATESVTVLATSRSPLRVRGEHEYPVPPLDLGPSADDSPPSELAASAAVRLFVDRAKAARADFELTDQTAATVAQICRRLDGLPLAIELAAARVRLLPPDGLLRRLGDSLDTFGAGPSDLPARQRTLRATIAWSVDLLDEHTAGVMAQLSVFVDGWTLEAAAAVCQLDEAGVLEAVDALVSHSLVVVRPTGDDTRFHMFETIRAFSADRLAERPDADAIAVRHADYFSDLAARAQDGLRGRGQAAWGDRLEAEQGNLRATLRWLIDHRRVDTAAHLIRNVWIFWWLRDHLLEAGDWITQALRHIDAAGALARGELLWAAWATALQTGQTQEAQRRMVDTMAAMPDADDPLLEAIALLLQAYTLPTLDDLDGAAWSSQQALERFRALGEEFLVGMAVTNLGTIRQMRGDLVAARQYQEQAMELGRLMANDRLVAQSLNQLGVTALREGDLKEAQRLIDTSADMFLESGSAEGLGLSLSAYAWLAVAEGDLERAAVARGAADHFRRRVGIDVWPVVQQAEQELGARLRSVIGDDGCDLAWARGAAMTPKEAIAAARSPAPVTDRAADAGP